MENENDVRLERIYEKQITIFGRALRVKRLILISLVTMAFGIVIYLKVATLFWLVFAFFFFCLFIFSFLLYTKAILYFGEYSIETSASGDMFITKLFGQCSICLGELKIAKNSKGTFIKCQVDKNHIWDVADGNKNK